MPRPRHVFHQQPPPTQKIAAAKSGEAKLCFSLAALRVWRAVSQQDPDSRVFRASETCNFWQHEFVANHHHSCATIFQTADGVSQRPGYDGNPPQRPVDRLSPAQHLYTMASEAILTYLKTSTFPPDTSLPNDALTTSDLSTLLSSLRASQISARDSLREHTTTTTPALKSWVTQARELQTSIANARIEAAAIVAEAEAVQVLRAEAEEKGRKVLLLEREVGFTTSLTSSLEEIKGSWARIRRARDALTNGDLETTLSELDGAEAGIDGLEAVGVKRVLGDAIAELRAEFRDVVTERWDEAFVIGEGEVTVGVEGGKSEQLLNFAKGCGVLDELTKKLANDLTKHILGPLILNHPAESECATSTMPLKCKITLHPASAQGSNSQNLFTSLTTVLNFLHNSLPKVLATSTARQLIPALTSRLSSTVLSPALPLSTSEILAFDTLLSATDDLADKLESFGWDGTQGLREWISDVPTLWVGRMREKVLGEVRDAVFAGVGRQEVVERVERRIVRAEEQPAATSKDDDGNGQEDEWESAWEDKEDGETKPEAEEVDEDASAWELDDDDAHEEYAAQEDDSEDWGAWDDNASTSQTSKPPSPTTTRKSPALPAAQTAPNGGQEAQEIILRENLTVTDVPSDLLQILQTLLQTATDLSTTHSDSVLAPAAPALYTLPTLALAIYRATAPTTYAKSPVGNMLIYNDTLHLSSLLQNWATERAAAALTSGTTSGGGRLRLDNDLLALESFGRKAYALEMESQRTILRDLLDGAQGFARCTSPPFKGECVAAVEGTVQRLRDVGELWRGVLGRGAWLQSLGGLLGTVVLKIIAEVEDLGDIGEDESGQLHKLCGKVVGLKDLFMSGNEGSGREGELSDGLANGGGEGEQDMTSLYCPPWLKFQYLSEILVSSLADIRWMWKEGELKLEFGAEEVMELVEALFAESELRRAAVREIRRG